MEPVLLQLNGSLEDDYGNNTLDISTITWDQGDYTSEADGLFGQKALYITRAKDTNWKVIIPHFDAKSSDFTLEWWHWCTSSYDQKGQLIGIYNGTNLAYAYHRIQNSRIYWVINKAQQDNEPFISDTYNVWRHHAVTVQNSADGMTVTFYYNGTKQLSKTFADYNSSTSLDCYFSTGRSDNNHTPYTKLAQVRLLPEILYTGDKYDIPTEPFVAGLSARKPTIISGTYLSTNGLTYNYRTKFKSTTVTMTSNVVNYEACKKSRYYTGY